MLLGLRRVLQAPCPHLPLLREAAGLAAFCGGAGGPQAVAALVAGPGGLLPALMTATMRCTAHAVRAGRPARVGQQCWPVG